MKALLGDGGGGRSLNLRCKIENRGDGIGSEMFSTQLKRLISLFSVLLTKWSSSASLLTTILDSCPDHFISDRIFRWHLLFSSSRISISVSNELTTDLLFRKSSMTFQELTSNSIGSSALSGISSKRFQSGEEWGNGGGGGGRGNSGSREMREPESVIETRNWIGGDWLKTDNRKYWRPPYLVRIRSSPWWTDSTDKYLPTAALTTTSAPTSTLALTTSTFTCWKRLRFISSRRLPSLSKHVISFRRFCCFILSKSIDSMIFALASKASAGSYRLNSRHVLRIINCVNDLNYDQIVINEC